MNTSNRKIAGFMSAESIYSLAFYVIMVAAIAGVGASVLLKKDAAKAVAAISLLRANFVADTATLGYPDPAIMGDGYYVQRMSGNLLDATGVAPAGVATLPGGGEVTLVLRTGATVPLTGFSINVDAMSNQTICNAIGGVGWGTWTGFVAAASPTAIGGASSVTNIATKSGTRALCDDIVAGTAATHVSMTFVSN